MRLIMNGEDGGEQCRNIKVKVGLFLSRPDPRNSSTYSHDIGLAKETIFIIIITIIIVTIIE